MSAHDASPAAVPDVTALAQTIKRAVGAIVNCTEQSDYVDEQERIVLTALAALLALVEQLQKFAFGDAPEWEKANSTLKHRVRELEAELERARQERDEEHDLRMMCAESYENARRWERERDAAQARERELREALSALVEICPIDDVRGREWIEVRNARAALAAADTPAEKERRHQALGRCRCGDSHTIEEAITLNGGDT